MATSATKHSAAANICLPVGTGWVASALSIFPQGSRHSSLKPVPEPRSWCAPYYFADMDMCSAAPSEH